MADFSSIYRPVLTFIILATSVAAYEFGDAAIAPVDTPKLLVLEAELVDTSLEGEFFGPDAAEKERLTNITKQLAEGLRDSNQYLVLDRSAVQDEIGQMREQVVFLHDCGECIVELGGAADADLVLAAWVQKVSDLILNLNVVITDVGTGSVVKTAFVDIRGNTDQSWQRGTRFMLERRLLCPRAERC